MGFLGAALKGIGSAAKSWGKGQLKEIKNNFTGDNENNENSAQNPAQDSGAPQEVIRTAPIEQMKQLPMYHDGGDVPKDQVAKLAEGERVLNPMEANAYKSAAIGNPPPTILGRIADRAHELYEQGKALVAPEDTEAEAFKQKQQNIDTYMRSLKSESTAPVSRSSPEGMIPVGVDKVSPNAMYGSKPGEKRPEEVLKTFPRLPSYDDGGNVPDNQIAKVHEGEHVLDPEKAEAYRKAEQEVMTESKGAPADFSGPVFPNTKNIKPRLDTEPAEDVAPLTGAKMYTANPPKNQMEPSNAGGVQEISAKNPLGQAAPAGAELKRLQVRPEEGITVKPTAEDMEAAKASEVPAPDINSIIQGDKLDAAKKGHAGLADLGLALIHEKSFAKPEYTGTKGEMQKEGKDKYQQTVDALRFRMLHGTTEQERFQAEKDLANYKLHTPWGGAESAHPGILGKIGHVAGQIGQAALMPTAPYILPMIPGSQVGLQEEAARGEKGVEEAQKTGMAEAQMATEQQKPELKQAAADLAEQKLENAQNSLLRKQQLKVNAAGNQVPLTYEELTPHEQGAYDFQNAKANAQNAIAELKQAQADPDSPQSKLILEKAKAESKKLEIAAGRLGIEADKYKADYLGVDHAGNPLHGVETDDKGNPIGPKIAKGNETTSQRLNKADLAQNVQMNVKNVKALIDKNPDLFGKAAGRISTFNQMLGTNDPALGEIPVIVYNIGLAAGGIHSQRGLAAAQHAADLLLNAFKNGPDATKAALDEMSSSVQNFIDAAKSGKHVAPTPKAANETPTPKSGEKPVSAFDLWKSQQK